MVEVRAVSMVGGTIFHREMIQREISRVLVLNLSGKKAVPRHCSGHFRLDRAFSLIEGHPAFLSVIAMLRQLIFSRVALIARSRP